MKISSIRNYSPPGAARKRMSQVSVPLTDGNSPTLRNYHLIHKLYVLLDASDRQVLDRFGLIGSQFRLLMNLDPIAGQRLTTLSTRLLLSKSTISRIIDQLEAMGWVKRVDDPNDRRAQRVILTPLGSEQRAMISAVHLKQLSLSLADIPLDQLEQLELLLRRVSQCLSDVPLETSDVN